MKKAIQKDYTVSAAKRIVAIAMMLLLVWITGINFLYLSKSASSALVTCTTTDGDEDANSGNNNPAGPDEKSPDAPITLSEEFIHEYHNPVNPDWISMLFQHKIHETEKLCIFHPESFSPPPEA